MLEQAEVRNAQGRTKASPLGCALCPGQHEPKEEQERDDEDCSKVYCIEEEQSQLH